jgi:hypothetical protein
LTAFKFKKQFNAKDKRSHRYKEKGRENWSMHGEIPPLGWGFKSYPPTRKEKREESRAEKCDWRCLQGRIKSG